jgi:phage tail sheath protein FI
MSQTGRGIVLFGDKTGLGMASAFDRINVRRLFIAVEKSIATAAESFLFEFNDEFTQTQFRNIVDPFLRDIQGRRGIIDFRVVSDSTVNTPEVIDRNEFRASIFIKPARSINVIELTFVATRTGIEFDEIVGQIS